jgi:arylsulfatase A-like enzyme/tetratricopeptide (TPR) repeat protein
VPQRLLVLVALACASAACTARGGASVFPHAPVLLVSIDTLRADHLPAYGYRGVETPHIDRLRRDGVLVERAYSPCPLTLPSHLTMLTGLLPPQHGVRNNVGFVFLPAAHATLPRLLAAQGYATGAAVSADVLRRQTGLSGAFQDYDDAIDPGAGAAFVEHQRPGGKTAAIANAWIDAHRERPFFFFLHLYEPHVPYDPPPPFRERYASFPYDGEIAAADAIVGDVIAHLESLGLYDRTLVVLTSDHGEGLGDHGEDQHGILLHVEDIHVPLILKLPGGAQRGESLSRGAHLVDLMPTVLRLVGVEPPQGLAGIDLLRTGAAPSRPLYSETLYPQLQLGWSALRSIVDERFHYIEGPRPELYDLGEDPHERHDLAGAQPERAAALARALAQVSAGPQRPGPVDPQQAEALAALGYVGGVRERGDSGALPNPKDELPSLGRLREGFRLAAAGQDAQAALVLGGLVHDHPAMVEAWIRLGEVLDGMGRYDQAVTALTQALERSPAPLADVRVSLGYAQLHAGRPQAAAADAQRALPLVPEKAQALLARAALAQGLGDEAEEHARAAIAAAPPQPSSLLLLAEVLTARGRFAPALAEIDHAAARAAELKIEAVPRLDFLRADALARAGRPAEAEAAYRLAIQRFPRDLQAYSNLAVLLWLLARRAEAEQVLAEMAAANPRPQAYQLAARTLETLGQKDHAAVWRRRASGQ